MALIVIVDAALVPDERISHSVAYALIECRGLDPHVELPRAVASPKANQFAKAGTQIQSARGVERHQRGASAGIVGGIMVCTADVPRISRVGTMIESGVLDADAEPFAEEIEHLACAMTVFRHSPGHLIAVDIQFGHRGKGADADIAECVD